MSPSQFRVDRATGSEARTPNYGLLRSVGTNANLTLSGGMRMRASRMGACVHSPAWKSNPCRGPLDGLSAPDVEELCRVQPMNSWMLTRGC
jgi:hypothetical protein